MQWILDNEQLRLLAQSTVLKFICSMSPILRLRYGLIGVILSVIDFTLTHSSNQIAPILGGRQRARATVEAAPTNQSAYVTNHLQLQLGRGHRPRQRGGGGGHEEQSKYSPFPLPLCAKSDAGFWSKKVDFQIVVQLIYILVCLQISCTTTKNRLFSSKIRRRVQID